MTWELPTVLGTLGALALAVLVVLLALERRDRNRLRQAVGGLEALGVGWRQGQDGGIVPVVPVGDPLGQDDYAEVLAADRVRIARDFEWDRAAGSWFCRRCRRRATLVGIHHPIWDGPFEGAGTGVVDRRDVPWCPACERLQDLGGLHAEDYLGLPSPPGPDRGHDVSGRPIRLPWLDRLPVRLRPELFERAAFHRLPVQVERFRPPPAGDAAAEEGPPKNLGPGGPGG